jgi:aminoglycoside phosphotransferase (APT) family kinase protein
VQLTALRSIRRSRTASADQPDRTTLGRSEAPHKPLHQAATGFRPAITSYRFHPYPPKAGEIISHGDLGPWNTVYRDGIPVAFIDWDAAQPIEPLTDRATRGPHARATRG